MVSPAQGSTDITLTGFLTPQTLPVSGKLFLSAQEGDAVLTGDRMLFGANVASLFPLSGPNNPAGNFFASQINDENGQLNTVGTFGTRNANAAAGTNSSACRQGLDITAVNVSPLLTAGMTTAAIRFTTDGDLYVANCLGLQIDSEGVQLQMDKRADRNFAAVGEAIGYTVTLTNIGSIRAETVTAEDLLPAGTELAAGSLTLNGQPYAGGLPVTFGPLEAGASAQIDFSARVTALPPVNPLLNRAGATYVFEPFPGFPVESSSTSNEVSVYVIDPRIGVNKAVDKALAAAGEELTYTSVITNGGNLSAVDPVFTDPIPAGTSFVPGSVRIDGVSYPAYQPGSGFPLPDLAAGQAVTVEFDVEVN